MLLIPRSAAKAAGWGDLEVYCQVGNFIDKNDVKFCCPKMPPPSFTYELSPKMSLNRPKDGKIWGMPRAAAEKEVTILSNSGDWGAPSKIMY